MTPLRLLEGIGSRVRSRRTSMGWTLKDVSQRSGVSCRFLTDLEAGRGNISVVRLSQVARALDVPLVSLFPADGDERLVISLIGLRGAGKSTVGAALGRLLKLPFVELDSLIEKQANLSLADLFSLHGEGYYKRLAYEILLKILSHNDPMIIAVGGSIPTDPEMWQLLKRRTHTVWLKAMPEAHWKRVLKQGDTRPMANRSSAMAELRSILAQRTPFYSEAAQTIDTGTLRVAEAVRTIAGVVRAPRVERKK